MATIKASIMLHDGMSSPLGKIERAAKSCVSTMEDMKQQTEEPIKIKVLDKAKEAVSRVTESFRDMRSGIDEARNQQENFNNSMHQGHSIADTLANKINRFVGLYALKRGFEQIKSLGADAMGAFDVANASDKQLKVVLKNTGAAEGAYDSLVSKAKQLQNVSMYGDSALIAGAAEIASYIKDPEAIELSMGTLVDYSAGMSGGIAIDDKQMVDYATQIGKALDGNLQGFKVRGFDATEAQKEILEFGSDMEKAQVIADIINESWQGLGETMAKTPLGIITQFQNQMSSLQASVGEKVYPAFLRFIETVGEKMPQIEQIAMGLADVFIGIFDILAVGIDVVISVAEVFVGWGMIEPILWGLAAAMVAFKVATLAQAVAQGTLNLAMLASPITWIALAIGVVVLAIAKWVKSVGSIQIAWAMMTNKVLTVSENLKLGMLQVVTSIVTKWMEFQYSMLSISIGIQNYMGDMKVGVLTLLQNMVNGAIDLINSFISMVNKIPGVGIEAIAHVSFATRAGVANELQQAARNELLAAERAEVDASIANFDNLVEGLKTEYDNNQRGREAEIAGMQAALENDDFNLDYDMGDPGPGIDYDDIANDIGSTAGNTAKMANSMDIAEDDLKYLRDIAERDAINRFTTAEIHVDMGGITNNVSSNTDLDGIVSYLTETVQEAMEVAAEGVHA